MLKGSGDANAVDNGATLAAAAKSVVVVVGLALGAGTGTTCRASIRPQQLLSASTTSGENDDDPTVGYGFTFRMS